MTDEGALESKIFSNVITNAQKQIEGRNFDIRKNLLDYDDVISRQRKAIYEKRDAIMFADSIDDLIQEFFTTAGLVLAHKSVPADSRDNLINGEELRKLLEPRFLPVGSFKPASFDEAPADDAGQDLGAILYDVYQMRRKQWAPEVANQVEREIALQTIDQNWTKQIDTMAHLREAIHLRSYANVNPLQDYVNEGSDLFRECLENISIEAVFKFLNVVVQVKVERPSAAKETPAEEPVEVEAKDKAPEESKKE